MKLEEQESESNDRSVSDLSASKVIGTESDSSTNPMDRPPFSSVKTSSADPLQSTQSSATAPLFQWKQSHAITVSPDPTGELNLLGLTDQPEVSNVAQIASQALAKQNSGTGLTQTSKKRDNIKKLPYLAPWKQDVKTPVDNSHQSTLDSEVKQFQTGTGKTYNALNVADYGNIFQGDTVIFNHYRHPASPNSLFSIFPASELDDGRGKGEQRGLYRDGRQQSQLLKLTAKMPGTKNEPYFNVDNKFVRQPLSKIAKTFQFLDHGFAEYFRMSISTSQGIRDQLRVIRDTLHERQHPDKRWVGALGDFCEEVISSSDRSSIPFEIQDRGPEILKYLQDALEVPYWNLVVNVFIQRSEGHDVSRNSIQVVRSVVKDMRQEIELHRQALERNYPGQVHDEIQKGINARLDILDDFLEWTPQPFDVTEKRKAHTCQFSRTHILASTEPTTDQVVAQTSLPQPEPQQKSKPEEATDLEKVSSFTLLIIFLVSAFIPAAIGFSGYYKLDASSSNTIGSVSDPDFYWLISGTLMAVLGNLYSIVPLLKLTRGTETYWASWGFWFLSTAFGASSIGTYPILNKCWSSSFSLFCSMFAIASVFVSTLSTGNQAKTRNKTIGDGKLKTQ